MKLINIKPPFIALVLLSVSLALNFLIPLLKPIPEPYNFFGILITIFGLIISAAGRNEFKKADTPLLPTAKSSSLVISGPFKFTRNPMYLGLSSLLAGFGIFMNSIYIFTAALIFFFIINFVFVPFEEKDMEETFGKSYIDYKSQVRRWL